MITCELTIENKLGLHARAASKFVAEAQKFAAEVTVDRGGKAINGKSIMAVMLLAASKGTVIKVSADGADEREAMDAIATLLADKFGEGQ